MVSRSVGVAAGLLLVLVGPHAGARKLPPNIGGGQNITVQGVYVDAKGVLKVRQAGKGVADRFRRDAKLGPEFVAISLPKLFAEVQRLRSAGKRLPDRIRYLDGLVKLQYVVVDRAKKDLIIAGPAEPIDARNSLRPLGRKTGRPVLQLDDLVVALRMVGPGRKTRAFGCSLTHDPKAIARVAALQKTIRRIRPGGRRRVQSALREAIGPLTAEFFGVPADTRFAFVCVEADYQMKRISIGHDRPPVRGLKSYLSLSKGTATFSRFWFVANYPPLRVSKDGRVFEIPQRGLKLLAGNSPTDVKTTNPAAVRFAEIFTRKLADLERTRPVFADLQNLADVAVLAALIDTDRLAEKAGWDLSWLLKPDGYSVAKIPAPRTAETLVSFKSRGRRTVTVAGGVRLTPRKFAAKRKQAEMAGALKRVQRTFGKNGAWSRRMNASR
ncbi:MAG: DUF1598 domain-containing protein [Planctomycetaceae bacterium]